MLVSIHASVKDATERVSFDRHGDRFNPRIRKRCDMATGVSAVAQQVSIHASVKDATPCL